MMTLDQLAKASGAPLQRAAAWLDPIIKAMDAYEIDTPVRQVDFVAQIGHESASLAVISENLNYSADGLLNTFPKYFNPAQAQQYARQPERIANRVYANRMGNGDEGSGDGWKYRGKGLIQLTGKQNYALASISMDLDLVENPDLLLVPDNAAAAAGWFWWNNKLNRFSDSGDFVGLTKAINGGTHGLADRQARRAAGRLAFGLPV